jgi:hypothetical protein
VVCGETPTGASKPVKAKLTLDPQSKLTVDFGRDKTAGPLSLIYKASGCELPPMPSNPALTPVALAGQDSIPDDTLVVVDTTPTDSNQLILRVQALPNTFDPGTYSSLVFVASDYTATKATTITLSRSETDWKRIGLYGLGAALVGVLIPLGVSLTTDKLSLGGFRLALVVLLMLGSGLYAAWANWWTQDVWTFDANLKGLLGVAATAAGTGTLAGLIGGGGGSEGEEGDG